MQRHISGSIEPVGQIVLLDKKTGCHVYYFHDRERDLIEIHSIWGARRERGPYL